MNEKESPGTYYELSSAFLELFDSVLPEDSDEIDELLREMGFNPIKVAAGVRELADRAMAESPLNWQVQAARKLKAERARYTKLIRRSELSRKETLAQIQSFLNKGPADRSLRAAHRNLQDMSDEDLMSLLEDLLYLSSSEQQDEDFGR